VDDGAASSFIMPSVVDRSPLIVAVSSGGRAPVLARLLRQRLEQWLPARIGALAGWAGRWRERVRERLPQVAPRRDFWERLLTGTAAAAVLRGNEAEADVTAQALLDRPAGTTGRGMAWLVGAGPGDPGLISVHGLRILEQADVILHDRLVAPELLRSARREAEVIGVGKTGGGASTDQDTINALLIRHVRAGRKVCRLKGGDPLIFGRGAEEALALATAGLPFEIVPGISAASGCAAFAGIPLTHRGLSASVTLVTAQQAPGTAGPDWPQLASGAQTLVVYMGGSRVASVADALVAHGRAADTPAAVIVEGTLPGQQVITGTLADIAARSAALRGMSPALLIVGETVSLAAALGGSVTRAARSDDAECTSLHGPAALVG
jgi:uroporphyrin-III C-methyltransferase/precorrin-2 dehydrogenase/sirohydrochlorin ferrochelatase